MSSHYPDRTAFGLLKIVCKEFMQKEEATETPLREQITASETPQRIRAVRRDEIDDVDAGSKVTALQAWADAVKMTMEDHVQQMCGSARSWKTWKMRHGQDQARSWWGRAAPQSCSI